MDNDKEFDYYNTATDVVQKVLMTASLTMKNLFPIKLTTEVCHKFLLINVKSPDILLLHIMDWTLNTKLKPNDYLSMNNTILQVLLRATPCFNILIGIDKSLTDTTQCTIRKKKTML